MVRLRIDLSYDGAGFAGWARQREQRTVQGTLEEALTTVLRLPEPAQLTVAGRTDAGVHARGQVAHLDVSDEVWAASHEVALRRVAGALPRDVRVRDITLAPDGFDARFGAIWRRYAYRVCDAPGGVDPLRRGDVVWHDRPLDADRMNGAAELLLGEHDFASFCRKREGATTVRCLQAFSWARETPTGADAGPAFVPVIVGTVRADAFCHNMVRSLVGAMFAVGTGRKPIDWPREVLGRAVRDSGVHVAQAHGLTLEEVAYPEDGLLGARVLATRRRRDGS